MKQSELWPVARLGDHIDLLTGYPFKSADYTDDPHDIPLLRGYNVVQEAIRWENMKRWPVEELDKYSEYELKPGDVVLAMDRPWIEAGLKHARIRERDCPMLLVQRVARLRGTETLDTDFLHYVITHHSFAAYLQAIVTGVSVPHISGGQIRSFEFRLPPLATQRKIATVLSAYDDLIENNTRRIAVLEEMARLLYQEWFVRFRFPGHEGVAMVDSGLGLVPEGWEVVKLSTAVETRYGYTESAREEEIGPKFVRGTDINKTTYIEWDSVPYCPIEDSKYPKYQLFPGDILVIRMADPGKVGIVEKEVEAVFASYLIRLTIKSEHLSPYYLFYFLLSDRYQGYITGASTGTTRKSASAGVITDFDILIPPDVIRQRFENQVVALRESLNNLLERNANLRRTRDLLLPRLVSGQVDVSELEIDIGGLE